MTAALDYLIRAFAQAGVVVVAGVLVCACMGTTTLQHRWQSARATVTARALP